MKNIIRTCNLMVRFSKFTFIIKIYEEFVEFLFKLVWRETLFLGLVSYQLCHNILKLVDLAKVKAR